MHVRRGVLLPALPVLLAALVACDCGGGADRWQTVFTELPAGLVAVSGTSASDVWAVGGDARDGSGPLVLHWDGAAWTRRRTGVTAGDLWWVHPFATGEVFLGGRDGLLLRYQNSTFERLTPPRASTVFGLWGAAPDDVWAVGGDGNTDGFAWRWRGARFEDVPLPAGVNGSSMFKVWGKSASDVWVVGTQGAAVHFDGTALAAQPSGTTRNLFTVHADADRFVAVGGFGTGVIVENEAGNWVDRTPSMLKQTNGVFLSGGGGGFGVGVNGSVVRRSPEGWVPEATGLDLAEDLHGVWVDDTGGVWAVGGQVASYPLTRGVLIHRGRGPALPTQWQDG